MLRHIGAVSLLSLALASGAARFGPAQAKEFTYDAKTNEQLAKKLKIPVFFAVPASARAPLPSIETTDRLVEFKHPDGANAQGNVGLRLVMSKRAGLAKRLGKSGLIQTGDILLSFRSEWGGAGAYPNIQMGISHTGIAYVKDGIVHNLDNPMDADYLGRDFRGQLNGSHYNGLKFIHVIRPRNLTDKERENILGWTTRLNASAKKVYPSQIKFNDNYNDPKYKPGKSVDFVKQLAQIGLGQNPPGPIDMYCSEFVWSILALRRCDPATSGDAFKGPAVPSCVQEAMTPLDATGNFVFNQSRSGDAGLADGPLLIINSMNLPEEERTKHLKAVFTTNDKALAKISTGHQKVAKDMEPHFRRLEGYYLDTSGGWEKWRARAIRLLFNSRVPDNYSPTSYLINTLLPPDNSTRTMDYVATIAIE
jgi:hypothetical protein